MAVVFKKFISANAHFHVVRVKPESCFVSAEFAIEVSTSAGHIYIPGRKVLQ
jgi:hypothetical protein